MNNIESPGSTGPLMPNVSVTSVYEKPFLHDGKMRFGIFLAFLAHGFSIKISRGAQS
jgi:hypothetical protein